MRRTGLGLAVALTASAAATGAAAQAVCDNRTGVQGGYFFSFWRDSGAGCINLGEAGAYSTTWRLEPSGNMVAGKGWAVGSPGRVVGYRARAFEPGANGYLALYGWSTDPVVEYYVVDNWGGFRPPGQAAVRLGLVESDGGTYEIYRTQRVEAPSIRGRTTFFQYWSVRTARRPVGPDSAITFANHVAAWRSHGMSLGTMAYQILATEGFGSRGASDLAVWEAGAGAPAFKASGR